MTRTEALAALRRLAVGLAPDLAGVNRLLERVAAQGEEAEMLLNILIEQGAERVLHEEARR